MKYRGVDYYPEAWPEERWSEDIRLMKEAKINLVKVGVFSWSELEPEEGVFKLDCFEKVCRFIADAGMKLFIATPTAAPPAWITSNYPETLNRDELNNTPPHGVRRHYCPSSPLYRQFSSKIVAKLAELFHKNPAVVAWQIDNEISIGETGPCYCQECNTGFHKWLKNRYGSLENLNIAWNTVFWGANLSSWEQIKPPYPRSAWQLDYIRFYSELFGDFIKAQMDEIRKFDKESVITTNSWAGLNAPVDATEIFRNLDLASYDCYINYHGTLQAYQATMDLYRNIKHKSMPFWIAETGAWNCITTEDHVPDALRAWFYEFLARGADAVIYFRWRQSIMGEEDHPAILNWSGKPGNKYENIKNIFTEFESLENELQAIPLAETEVAILWSPSTALLMKIKNRPYMEHVILADNILNKIGLTPDILPVSENLNLSKYKLIILPQLEMVDKETAIKIIDFVKNGGVVLAQPRLGLLDSNGKYIPETAPALLKELFGIEIDERYDISGTPKYGPVQYGTQKKSSDSKKVKISCLFINSEAEGFLHMEAPIVNPGTKVIAEYSSGIFKGSPAIVERSFAKGESIYQACWMDDATTTSLFQYATKRAGIAFEKNKPEDVTIIKRGQFYFYINHSNKNRDIASKVDGHALLGPYPKNGKVTLAPYEISIIKER